MADAIFDAVVGVCADACGCIRDQGQLNGFPKGWLFHSRWGIGPDGTGALPDGRTIRTSTVGGRTTAVFFCVMIAGFMLGLIGPSLSCCHCS